MTQRNHLARAFGAALGLALGITAIALYAANDSRTRPRLLWNETRHDKELVTVGTHEIPVLLKDGREIKAAVPILVEKNRNP